MRRHPRRTFTNPQHPDAWGTCDRSGFVDNQKNLCWQYEWAGQKLVNLKVLVTPDMLDKPQRQLGTIILPPDPLPIMNARPEQYRVEEPPVSTRVTMNGAVRVVSYEPYPIERIVSVQGNLPGVTWTPPSGAVFDVYVSSVNGSDSNAGTLAAPLQTIAAASAKLRDGVRIGLQYGSVWREELDASAYGKVTIGAYGNASAPLPCLRADDVIESSDWSKTGGFANIYQISFTFTVTDSGNEDFWVWEAGNSMPWVSSLATLDTTPGAFYTPNSPAGGTDTITIYVHATGSGNPATNGYVYERTARDHGLIVGDNATVSNIWTRRQVHHDGSFFCGANGTVSGCIFSEGQFHCAFGEQNTIFANCISFRVLGTNRFSGATNYVIFAQTIPPNSNATFRGCVAYNDDYPSDPGQGAFLAHGGGTFDYVLTQGCFAYANEGYGANNTSVVLVNDCYAEGQVAVVCSNGIPTTVDGLTHLSNPLFGSTCISFDVSLSSAVIASDVAVCLPETGAFSVGTGDGSANDVTISNLSFTNTVSCLAFFELPVTMSDSIIDNQPATTTVFDDCTVTGTNDNLYSGGISYDGTHNTLSSWQSASGQDANSIAVSAGNVQFTGNPANGDFTINPSSPAVANKWGASRSVTRPNWLALTARWNVGLYAHPFDAIGGSRVVVTR